MFAFAAGNLFDNINQDAFLNQRALQNVTMTSNAVNLGGTGVVRAFRVSWQANNTTGCKLAITVDGTVITSTQHATGVEAILLIADNAALTLRVVQGSPCGNSINVPSVTVIAIQ